MTTKPTVKFLLVDDLAENRIALEALLRRDGLELLQAASGAQALELLLQHEVALALLDVQMPEMDGFELAEIMRGTERTRRVPIIFLTAGGPDNQRRFRGYETGAVDFLYKPIEPHVLQSKAGVFFDLYRERAEVARQRDALELAAKENARLLESEKVLRARAEQEGRAKDEFLATLSHELRTPLNAILGWTQLIETGVLSEDERREGLTVIDRNARTQAQLIDDLLDMSRIISGKVRLEQTQLDVADVIAAACDTVAPAAEAKGVRLENTAERGTARVRGDAARLQQVFWNLLTNAVKFTPAGGAVGVRLGVTAGPQADANSVVLVDVTDTGEGVSSAFLPHLFERFRQADGTTTRRHGGLGLGLSIVRNLVTLHGGTVEARSDGPNHGATFTVTLPCVVEDVPTPPPPAGNAGCDARLDGLRVLVVDDHADARDVVRRLLEHCGATVLTAGSAAAALDTLAAHRPDVLVSDIGMPGEDGFSLIRRVRDLPDAMRDIPAIALTAFAHADDGDRAMAAGYHGHLSKPVNRATLVTTVARLASGPLSRVLTGEG